MTTPCNPDPYSVPKSTSPMGPPGASPFGGLPLHGNNFKKELSPPSKSMAMWEKFLGAGATPAQVERFQSQFLNAITRQFKQEAEKSRERQKKDARIAAGEE